MRVRHKNGNEEIVRVVRKMGYLGEVWEWGVVGAACLMPHVKRVRICGP